jgi:muramoyltetrapeptide carboxypeptidase LdcA involved in peptidoglycan recycling
MSTEVTRETLCRLLDWRDGRQAASSPAPRGPGRREAVLSAVADYNPELVVALDVDFGHTSPQLVLSYGGQFTVDGERQRLIAHFG